MSGGDTKLRDVEDKVSREISVPLHGHFIQVSIYSVLDLDTVFYDTGP